MSVSVPPSSGSTSRLAYSGSIIAGRYRLEEVVGHGGMGSVWRATHTGLGEQVAVKLVAAHFVKSSEALRRFDTEAKAAARLRSRHVPQVFDNGVLEDGTPFLVMELLYGESLAARLTRLGPIPLPETAVILDQAARALTRAHSLGIVHRDIKPENIYLAQSVDDDGYVVKVLDFGIAKVANSLSDDGRSSTRTGTLLGTPLYMSPEQARGLRSVDHRTDVYSLGLVAYTMLTGRTPFAGETLGELLLQICVEPLPLLRTAVPALPPATEDWFQKACARQPEERYPSPQALVEALRVAAGISMPSATDSINRRSPSLAGLGAPLAGAPPPYGTTGDPQAIPSTTAGTALGVPATTGPRTRWLIAGASGLAVVTLSAVLLFGARARKATESGAPSETPVPARSAETRVQPEREAGAAPVGVELAPLPSTTAEGTKTATPPPAGATEARPPATARPIAPPPGQPNAPQSLAPAPATARPPAPPFKPNPAAHPAAKPNGAIDLGY